MEKIERITDVYDYGDCVVKKSDLDELERDREVCFENWMSFEKMANEQRLKKLDIKKQRDEAVEIIRAFFMYPNYKRELVEGNNVISFLKNAYGQTWEEIKAGKG